MRTAQIVITSAKDADLALRQVAAIDPGLVLAFGSVGLLTDAMLHQALGAAFPKAVIAGCSTAGEISSGGIGDGSCVITGIHFDHTTVYLTTTRLDTMETSRQAGRRLGERLPGEGLAGVMLFGQGVRINGSALIEGLAEKLKPGVPITGGLAGDGGAFRQTWVLAENRVSDDMLLAIGFYGKRVRFGHGSFGGWHSFGPARKVTRCEGNVLHELDGAPALDVYKRYLGAYAGGLPASGLLFPFAMLGKNHAEVGLIRTILGIDEEQGSLTLAGEIEADGYLKLMHAGINALVDGAEAAAEAAREMLGGQQQGIALLVSCVGRKLAMGDRAEEEIEAVGAVLGLGTMLTGFYSYGEIGPFTSAVESRLHNQTMTVTCISES